MVREGRSEESLKHFSLTLIAQRKNSLWKPHLEIVPSELANVDHVGKKCTLPHFRIGFEIVHWVGSAGCKLVKTEWRARSAAESRYYIFLSHSLSSAFSSWTILPPRPAAGLSHPLPSCHIQPGKFTPQAGWKRVKLLGNCHNLSHNFTSTLVVSTFNPLVLFVTVKIDQIILKEQMGNPLDVLP